MKVIVSQCGLQVFTCGECQVYSIATVEKPGESGGKVVNAPPLYSIGVAGISFGQFKNIIQAKAVLSELVDFFGNKHSKYTVPPCAESELLQIDDEPEQESESDADIEAKSENDQDTNVETKQESEPDIDTETKPLPETKEAVKKTASKAKQ